MSRRQVQQRSIGRSTATPDSIHFWVVRIHHTILSVHEAPLTRFLGISRAPQFLQIMYEINDFIMNNKPVFL